MQKTRGKIMTGWFARFYDLRGPINGVSMANKEQLRHLNLREGDRLLDIGCGSAQIISKLHKKYGNKVFLFGIEPSRDMLWVARRKFQSRSAKTSVKLRSGIGESLPYKDNFFDWVTMSLVLHHLPPKAQLKTLREAYRVLKLGGRIVITDGGKPITLVGKIISLLFHNHAYLKEVTKGILPKSIKKAGFSRIKLKNVQLGIAYHITAEKAGVDNG